MPARAPVRSCSAAALPGAVCVQVNDRVQVGRLLGPPQSPLDQVDRIYCPTANMLRRSARWSPHSISEHVYGRASSCGADGVAGGDAGIGVQLVDCAVVELGFVTRRPRVRRTRAGACRSASDAGCTAAASAPPPATVDALGVAGVGGRHGRYDELHAGSARATGAARSAGAKPVSQSSPEYVSWSSPVMTTRSFTRSAASERSSVRSAPYPSQVSMKARSPAAPVTMPIIMFGLASTFQRADELRRPFSSQVF